MPPLRVALAAAHLALFPFFAGVALLLLCAYLKAKDKLNRDSVRYTFLLELGVALVVAAIVVWCVDLTVSRYQERQLEKLRASIQAATLTMQLEPKVGVDVARELRRQVIDLPIQYENYEVEGNLTYVVGPDSLDPHLSCNLKTAFDVVNTSSGSVQYSFRNKIAAVSPGRKVAYSRISFTKGDSPIVDFSGADVGKVVRPLGEGSDIGFQIPIQLEPNSRYKAYVAKSIGFELTDYYNVRTLYACSKMKLRFWYPRDRIAMEGSYLLTPVKGQADIDTSDSQVRAEVTSTLLPHQGILLFWRQRQ